MGLNPLESFSLLEQRAIPSVKGELGKMQFLRHSGKNKKLGVRQLRF
jgi:hypothetical protein